MKRVVLLFGGSGGRMAAALLFLACAGILPEEEIRLVLCDPDGEGMHGAQQLGQEVLDYQQLWASGTYIQSEHAPFRTKISLTSWCDPLPMNAKTLQDWCSSDESSSGEADALLCQALFTEEVASLPLQQGFHDHPELAKIAFAAMLDQAEKNPTDPMHQLLAEIRTALGQGEEVRVILAGSLCGGTGAAGLASLANALHRQFGQEALFRLGGVLMLPCAENESPHRAKRALKETMQENALETVCLIGLPESAQASGGNDLPRLTDLLGAYGMDVLLNRPTWLCGLFTIQAEEGRADWRLFGKGEERYRRALGGLLKGSLLWQRTLWPVLEKSLEKDNALKSGLTGWYPHFFRGAQESLEDVRADAAAIDRLTRIAMLWLSGIVRSLPLDMRYASALEAIRKESRTHYQAQVRRAGELAVLRHDAQENGFQAEQGVQRGEVTTTAEDHAMERIHRMEQEMQNEEAVQMTFNRQMGGDAAMRMVTEALEETEKEHTRLIHDHAEALRRIEQAEAIVKPSERFRIDDARTKLKRMERHQAMVEGMYQKLRTDALALRDGQLRYMKPALAAPMPENGLFLQEAMDRLLRGEQESKKELTAWYPLLVQGGKTADMRQMMKAMSHAAPEKDAPALWLMICAMELAMQEENQ